VVGFLAAHLLVVDDDRRVTSLLQRALRFAGYTVTIAHDGAAALKTLQGATPDLLLLDVMLPGIDGLSVCRAVRDSGPTPILMLTARDDIADRVKGLDAGADDYLVKPFAVAELLARVRAMLRRTALSQAEPPETTPAPMTFADLTLDPGAHVIRRGTLTTFLSTTELRLLRLFMLHPGQVLSRDLLMDRVWGADFMGESNVLEVYVRYLRVKTEQEGLPRLIHTVRGTGYVLSE
jgi:two-component system response regulator MprA